MKFRSTVFGAAAVVALAIAPRAAQAQGCGYTYSLGLGGAISGCFTGMISEIGEDAGYTSAQYYWGGNFGGRAASTNAPLVAGTFMFNNNCGSGGNGTFAFCTGAFLKPTVTIVNTSGEMVLGLAVPDPTYGNPLQWVYSGSSNRGDTPAPAGFQSVLLQLTIGGVDDPGQFMFGWEDLNSGCIARTAANNNRYAEEQLGNGTLLNTKLSDCTVILPGGNSDSDFNDSYMRFNIAGNGVPLDVVPEPMTMSLMAIGLVGMAATSIRRRRR